MGHIKTQKAKKVMLIASPEKSMLAEAGDRFNQGLLYIASSLRKDGHQVEISDLNHDSYKTLNNRIKNMSPDYIGMSIMSPSSSWAKDHSNYLKQKFPKVQTIAGGPHATGAPEDLVNNFDYVVRGEGEQAVLDIVNERSKKGIISAPFIKNLETLVNPATDLISLGNYGIERDYLGKRGALVDTSRGCIGNCFFCTKELRGHGMRHYSLGKLLNKMEGLQNAGFDWMLFTDDCFTADRQKAIDLMNGMYEKGIDLNFEVMTRADCVDESLLEKMKDNGLKYVSYGIEHADENVFHKCSVGLTKKGVKMTKDLGIKTAGTFIMNLPKATEKSMYNCLDFAVENLDRAKFFGLQAYPGTPLWRNPEKFGCTITHTNYRDCLSAGGETNVELENMPKEKAERIIKDIRNKWAKHINKKVAWV